MDNTLTGRAFRGMTPSQSHDGRLQNIYWNRGIVYHRWIGELVWKKGEDGIANERTGESN